MLDFQKYLMRYGECGVQGIVENIEKAHGIHLNAPQSLEQRWERVMNATCEPQRLAA